MTSVNLSSLYSPNFHSYFLFTNKLHALIPSYFLPTSSWCWRDAERAQATTQLVEQSVQTQQWTQPHAIHFQAPHQTQDLQRKQPTSCAGNITKLTHNSRKYNSNWPTMRRKYYLKSPTMRRKSNWNWLTIRNNLSYNWCLLIWKKVYVFPWRLLLLSGMHSTYKKEINKWWDFKFFFKRFLWQWDFHYLVKAIMLLKCSIFTLKIVTVWIYLEIFNQ